MADGITQTGDITVNADHKGFSAVDIDHDSVEKLDDGRYHQYILKNGHPELISWTREQEVKVVRKADWLFLPTFVLMFFWMAIDRTNISSVLSSTFLADTGISKDQANDGTSLLWLGIVLLEIPSNIVLHRVGAHYWIPAQVVVWGVIECLQSQVTDAKGYYVARLFLGLAESGFIPGSLYTLSRWYTQDELAKRTVIFFWGASISTAFGSLIAAGALEIAGEGGLEGWQWIFLICGLSTVATGIVSFVLIPKSPHDTGYLCGGLIPIRGWLSEAEADIFVARILLADPTKGQESSMKITGQDIKHVLLDWKTWPYLLVCLSGLQSVGGLSTWGTTIIKSLGFTSVRANLLNAPAPIVGCFTGLALGWAVDRYQRFGYAIMFAAVWTVAGLVAVYKLPVLSSKSWSFYAAYFVTSAAPIWQPINVTWLSLNSKTPQRRAIAYAVYIGCSNLGGAFGVQVFRASDAPDYTKAWQACIALGVVWFFVVGAQTLAFKLANRRENRKSSETEKAYVDSRGRAWALYW